MRISAVHPSAVDVRRGLPHRIPRRIAARRADADVVALRAGRVEVEEGAAQVIVVAVDHELEVIRIEVGVAAHEARRHTLRALGVVHLRAHVQRVVVKEKTDFGALRPGLAFVRIDLPELRDRRRRLPRLVVELGVEHDRGGSTRGHCCRHGHLVAIGRLRRQLRGRNEHRRDEQGRGESHSGDEGVGGSLIRPIRHGDL